MKKLIDMLLSMVYPALISLFIFVFVDTFTLSDNRQLLQLISALCGDIFGLMFVAGLVLNVIYIIKHKPPKE